MSCNPNMRCKPSRYMLEERVRKGTDPDNPEYLYTYLETAQECARQLPLPHRRNLYRQVFNTLISAAADGKVALHWRILCLDHACLPLCRLRPLCRTIEQRRELLQLRYQLASLGHYLH